MESRIVKNSAPEWIVQVHDLGGKPFRQVNNYVYSVPDHYDRDFQTARFLRGEFDAIIGNVPIEDMAPGPRGQEYVRQYRYAGNIFCGNYMWQGTWVFRTQCIAGKEIDYEKELRAPLREVFPIEMSAAYYRLEE